MQNIDAKNQNETAVNETAINAGDNTATTDNAALEALKGKAEKEKQKRKTSGTKSKEEKAAGIQYGLFCLVNGSSAGNDPHLRAHFIAGLMLAGVITATGKPTAKGGDLAKFKAICGPGATAVKHHGDKGGLSKEDGKLNIANYLLHEIPHQIKTAPWSDLIPLYLETIKTGKAQKGIKTRANAPACLIKK